MNSRKLLLLVFLLVAGLVSSARADELTLHVFDVGQGDAMLIVSPVGKTVLIDGGTPDSGDKLAKRLKALLKGPVDLMLMTHPHADHLGGMEDVLHAVGARIFMEPGFDHPSPPYAHLLRALEKKGVSLRVGKAGNNVELGGGAVLHLLAPGEPFFRNTRSDANANSIVARLVYGKTSFYLAADSEAETERRILESGVEIASDVYKVAHHGSRHASTSELLRRVRPKVAVIPVGARNDYGHPTREALRRLESINAEILRTDLDGEITFKSDGERVTFTTERGGGVLAGKTGPKPITTTGPSVPSEGGYFASLKGRNFHRANCASVSKIAEENRIHFPSRDEALATGRAAARCCKP